MERDEDLGGRVRTERVEIHHERGEHERDRRQHPVPGVEPPPVCEVRGEERQHEQTDVPHQPTRLLARCISSQSCNLHRDGRSHSEDDRLEPAAERPRR